MFISTKPNHWTIFTSKINTLLRDGNILFVIPVLLNTKTLTTKSLLNTLPKSKKEMSFYFI